MKQIGEMNFNQTTYFISMVLLCITALYTLVYSGITGLLFCSAIGLIVAAFVNQPELIAAAVIIFSLFYLFFLKRYLKRFEPFTNQHKEIVSRIEDIASKNHKQDLSNSRKEPFGVYNSKIEGFQDVNPGDSKDGAPSDSSSASTALTMNQVASDQVKAVTTALEGKSDEEVEKEEFKSATGTLFKTGKMPSENADGPRLDAGLTMRKAMETFDSNTVGAMTDDTKKLLASQKNLKEMLTQMGPILADGKELLQTFSGMFGGGSNGNGSGMPFKL